jgi:hypothetical protein
MKAPGRCIASGHGRGGRVADRSPPAPVAPRHARRFFESLIVDNLDLGRPHNVEINFGWRIRRDTPGW